MKLHNRRILSLVAMILLFVMNNGTLVLPTEAAHEYASVSAPNQPDVAECGNFTDVATSSEFYKGAQFYDCRNVANGYWGQVCANNNVGSPCFLPNTPITRGQLAKVVTLSHNYCCYIPPGQAFTDVAPGSTFHQYIETANWYDLMEPAGCNVNGCYFSPNSIANRGETARAIIKATGYGNVNAYWNDFVDVTPGTAWRAEIETAYARRLMTGRNGVSGFTNPCTNQLEDPSRLYFRPCQEITRGQVAKMDTAARFLHSAPYPGTFNWEQDARGVSPGLKTIPSGYVRVEASWTAPYSGPYNYDVHAYDVRWSASGRQWAIDNAGGGQYQVGLSFGVGCISPNSSSYIRSIYFSVPTSYRYYTSAQGDCGTRVLVNDPTSIVANTPYYGYIQYTDGRQAASYGSLRVANTQVNRNYHLASRVDWLAGSQDDLCYQNGFGTLKCP